MNLMQIEICLCSRIYTRNKEMIGTTDEVVLLCLKEIVVKIIIKEVASFCRFNNDETNRVIIK